MTNEEINAIKTRIAELKKLNDKQNKLEIRKKELINSEIVQEYLKIIEQENSLHKQTHLYSFATCDDFIDECWYEMDFTDDEEIWITQDKHVVNLITGEMGTFRDPVKLEEFKRNHNMVYAPEDTTISAYHDVLRREYTKTALEKGNKKASELVNKLVLNRVESESK